MRCRSWRLIDPETHSGSLNMALDEVASQQVANGGPPTIRVYEWSDTLSLGYAQDAATIDRGFCNRAGIEVTRRPTGGGAIYHDHVGDISYSIIAPESYVKDSFLETYHEFCAPLLTALSRLGVDAGFADKSSEAVHKPACYLRERSPNHDIVGPDGRKLSGNAQYRRDGVVVQHGSLSYSTRPSRHCRCFADRPDEGEFREHVGAIDEYVSTARGDVVESVRAALAEWSKADVGSWTDDELERAETLASEKYASTEWVTDRTNPIKRERV